MKTALLVGLGSFVGGSGRYLISKMLQQNIVNSFPYGTLTVNVVGCFLIGVVYGWSSKNPLDPTWQLFLTTGILGGFTTFSAFSMEAINLMKSGNLYGAILYIFLSVLVGLTATAIGYWIARIY
jgi:fluoride exporter